MSLSIETLRYKHDNIKAYQHLLEIQVGINTKARLQLLNASLQISKEITPSLFDIIKKVTRALAIETLSIEYYVSSDSAINAHCFSLHEDVNLIVVLTSGLVNCMNEDELSFVIGHEIGHYLFGHLNHRKKVDNITLSRYYQANEISADRVGLICCESIDSAIRAIVKTISGLDDRFISHNVQHFLHQHNALKDSTISFENLTHPSLPTRAKALSLFSMSTPFYTFKHKKECAPITREKLDKAVEEYLNDTSLQFLNNRTKENLEKLKMWLMLKIFLHSKRFEKEEKALLSQEIGKEKTEKIIYYLQHSKSIDIDNKLKEPLDVFASLTADEKIEFVGYLYHLFEPFKQKYKYVDILKAVDRYEKSEP